MKYCSILHGHACETVSDLFRNPKDRVPRGAAHKKKVLHISSKSGQADQCYYIMYVARRAKIIFIHVYDYNNYYAHVDRIDNSVPRVTAWHH